MPIETTIIEAVWGAPLIAVVVLLLALVSKRSPHKPPVIFLLVGAILGVVYAVAISLIAGPMITATPIPFLPFMGTIGGLVGLLRSAKSWRRSLTRINISMFLAVIGFIWISYFTLRRYMDQAAGSFRIVVIRQDDPSSQPIQWSQGDDWVTLSQEERKRVQEIAGNKGILRTLTSLSIGEHPKGTAILVMLRDTSQRIQFPMPDNGVAIFAQNEDGTWRESLDNSHIGMNRLVLSPAAENYFTRIEVEGPFGSQTTEVGISHH